jgi:hypothetical protein
VRFTPPAACIHRFYPSFPAKPLDFAVTFACRGGKTLDLRLQHGCLDTPLPQPSLAENLRLGKKPFLPL